MTDETAELLAEIREAVRYCSGQLDALLETVDRAVARSERARLDLRPVFQQPERLA